jgi:hypothetical protein
MIEVREMRDKMNKMIRRMGQLEDRIYILEEAIEPEAEQMSAIDKILAKGEKIATRKPKK